MYNIIPIFSILNEIGRNIQDSCGLQKFNNFFHTLVMSTFIKKVSEDAETKVQVALSRADVWSALSATSSHRVVCFSSL